jgi:hypothetical protein
MRRIALAHSSFRPVSRQVAVFALPSRTERNMALNDY